MEALDYENDVHIDENALDVEWLRQAELMRKYSNHAASAEKVFDEAKEKLDFVKASLDRAIRDNPEKYGIGKVTEAYVQSTLVVQETYRKANQELIDAKYELNIAKGAIRAIDQKKDSLENLVRLHGASYFAGPRIPRDLSSERAKVQDAKVRITGNEVRRRK